MAEIIIFGGSFDPIHLGHLVIADQARQQRNAEMVVFVPTFDPPHKTERKITEYMHRYIMASNAIEGNSYFEINDIERNLSIPSYTLNTVKALRDFYPSSYKLTLLIGVDMLNDMPNWHKPQSIIELCDILVVGRPGYRFDMNSLANNDKFHYIECPHLDISSSMIRDHVNSQKSIKYLVPSSVEEYIIQNSLYKSLT